MRITIVNSFFPPWRGGAETYVYYLSKHLEERGHEVTVICSSPPFEPGIQFVDGVKVERLRTCGKLYGTPIMPELFQKLMGEQADIIHANFPSPYIAYLASTISRIRGIPAVLTWHNDLPPVTRMARILVTAHDRLVLPLYLPQFSSIIATSRIYAETSRILEAHKDRVVVIPNGVDTQRFNPDIPGDEIRHRLGVDRGKIVLFVGALTQWHRYKGLDVLIQAMALMRDQVPEARLLIVGAGQLETEYRQLVSRHGLASCVIFAGNVPDDELPKYYACSDMLALPSKDRSEGFGLTILEANATGRPAIGTTVGGIPSVIRDGYNGLLAPPNDPTALAEAIKKALSDDDLLKRMGRNGRLFAEQHDWSIVAEQTENVYKRALAAH
ncbi:MAG: glycosyltransferase family 4 protein [Candidatus Bathyarchaeia archaeon]|jgi:glycosyltransferase involved in cell wall biosynthesis